MSHLQQPIRLAIIGLGKMGTFHTKLASANPNCTIVALVNPHHTDAHQELKKKYAPHATLYTSYADLSARDIDAAIIATPTDTHFPIAQYLLRHAISVLIEKPITPETAQAATLLELAKTHKEILHVGFVERYNAAFIQAQKYITQPLSIRMERTTPYAPRVAHDSVIIDLMIHDIDLLLQLITIDDIDVISVIKKVFYSEKADIAWAHLVAHTPTSDIPVDLVAQRIAHRPVRTITIDQEHETLVINLHTQTLTISREGKEPEVITMPHNALAEEIDHFLTAVLNKSDHYHEPEQALLTSLELAQYLDNGPTSEQA